MIDLLFVIKKISSFCSAYSYKIGLAIICILSSLLIYNLFYHSCIFNTYHYFTQSVSESKKRGAFLWEFVPSKDTIFWNDMLIEINECYVEYDMYSHGDGEIRKDTTSLRERLILNYRAGKETKFSPYNYSALLKKYKNLSTMEYNDSKSLTKNDTLCLVFYGEKRNPVDSIFLYPI